MLKKLQVITLVVMLTSTLAFGSGFSIYEHGAKASAMAGAFIAQANDASAIFYNPAGLTGLKGFNLATNLTIIQPSAYFLGPTSIDANLYSEASDESFIVPSLYATYQFNEKLAAGFGVFAPFGLGSDWGQDWVGRELATNSDVQVVVFNPNIAYKVLDNLSVAAGLEIGHGAVTLEKSVFLGYAIDKYAEFKLDGDAIAMSFNLGLQYKPAEKLTLGATYRHEMELDFSDGKASFELPSTTAGVAAALKQNLPNTKGSSKLVLPARIGLGIAYDFSEQLTVEVDYLRMNWSSYDELIIKFDEPVNGAKEQVALKKYEDQQSYRLGAEYRLNDTWALRAGYLRDEHAVPDEYVEPTLPEGDRNLYNFGFGYKVGSITIDAYYIFLQQEDREITTSKVEDMPFNGTYKSRADLFGATLGYSF